MSRFLRFTSVVVFILSFPLLAAADERPLRVALYADEGAGDRGIETVEAQLKEQGHEVIRVKGSEIAEGILSPEFDAVVFTGGSGSRQGNTLGEEGRENVRQFVSEGGGYVGICAGAYLACTGFSWGVGVLDARTVSPRWRRGRGMIEVEVTPAGEEVSGIPAGTHLIRYANGPILTPHGRDDIPPFETVAFFRTEVAENDTPVGIMIGAPAIARGEFGKGRVVVTSPHPESTDGLDGTFAPAAVRWASAGRVGNRAEAEILTGQ
jgi:putative intracellular protease/amidase